jgi:hypothetical protein
MIAEIKLTLVTRLYDRVNPFWQFLNIAMPAISNSDFEDIDLLFVPLILTGAAVYISNMLQNNLPH